MIGTPSSFAFLFFEDADAALYRVKEAGGNGVGFHEG